MGNDFGVKKEATTMVKRKQTPVKGKVNSFLLPTNTIFYNYEVLLFVWFLGVLTLKGY